VPLIGLDSRNCPRLSQHFIETGPGWLLIRPSGTLAEVESPASNVDKDTPMNSKSEKSEKRAVGLLQGIEASDVNRQSWQALLAPKILFGSKARKQG